MSEEEVKPIEVTVKNQVAESDTYADTEDMPLNEPEVEDTYWDDAE